MKLATLTSKSVIGSFLFALSLWGYTALNEEYLTNVEVPLELNLPNDKAIENELPEELIFEVRGTGWNLFNLIFFNTAKICEVDLVNDVLKSEHNINRQKLLTSVKYLKNVDPRDVIPENIKLKTGKVIERKIPVSSDLTITEKDGFIIYSELQFIPDSITIRGNSKLINSLKEWKTEKKTINDVYKTDQLSIELSDSLGGIVQILEDEVEVLIQVQQLSENVYYDIPIQITGGKLPQNTKLSNSKINVWLSGGVDFMIDYNLEDLKVEINKNDILSSNGFVKPLIKTGNDKIQILKTEPEFIEVIKSSKILSSK